MAESDRELFAKAVSDALAQKYDGETIMACESACSAKHYRKMSRIVGKHVSSTHRRRLSKSTALLIAAVLTLCSAVTVYACRENVRCFIEEVYDSFVKLTHKGAENLAAEITDAYFPSVMAEGYEMRSTQISPSVVKYEFADSDGKTIIFKQVTLNGTSLYYDAVNDGFEAITVNDNEIYYRYCDPTHKYVWSDSKYVFTLTSDIELSSDTLSAILGGLVITD